MMRFEDSDKNYDEYRPTPPTDPFRQPAPTSEIAPQLIPNPDLGKKPEVDINIVNDTLENFEEISSNKKNTPKPPTVYH